MKHDWIIDSGRGPITDAPHFCDLPSDAGMLWLALADSLTRQHGEPITDDHDHQQRVATWPSGDWLQLTGPEAR